MQEGMKKSRFSTNISLYLGNDVRQSHSYYGGEQETAPKFLNGTRLNSLEVTANPDFKVTILFNFKYLKNGTRLSYTYNGGPIESRMVYLTAPF